MYFGETVWYNVGRAACLYQRLVATLRLRDIADDDVGTSRWYMLAACTYRHLDGRIGWSVLLKSDVNFVTWSDIPCHFFVRLSCGDDEMRYPNHPSFANITILACRRWILTIFHAPGADVTFLCQT